jgi:hypothetical protein
MFDVNRSHFFLAGLVILFLGVEFRLVEKVTLTSEFTKFLAKQSDNGAVMNVAATAHSAAGPALEDMTFRKSVIPPDWVGWALVSLGAVLTLHSLAMKPV